MKTNSFILCAVICAGFLSGAYAQADMMSKGAELLKKRMYPSASDSAADSLGRLPGISARMKAAQLLTPQRMEKPELLLDRAIDSLEYVVGPGDKLAVYLWGRLEEMLQLEVNSEGQIVIPNIGVIDVRGKTLAETRLALTEVLKSKYVGVKMSVSLEAIRRFKCYVLGEVLRPGVYTATGVTRVSDAIEMAGGLTDSASTRGIRIVNDRLGERSADMAKFLNSGLISANPYVREGDRVFVTPRNEFVSINGYVNYSGEYDYCPGDKAGDIIDAAGGVRRGTDSSRIVITRFADNLDELERITLSFSELGSFDVQKDDRILVSGVADYRVHRNVVIEGEVRFAGKYAIRDNKTKLLDVIEMAGGLTEKASLGSSMIIRDSISVKDDREFERLAKLSPEMLEPFEKTYLRARAWQDKGIVALDFSQLENSGDAYNITVRNNDRIIIARKDLTVRVSGAVVTPGHVRYSQDASVKDYIGEAGGFGADARKRWVRVRKNGTQAWTNARDIDRIDAGDEILVVERPYRDSFITFRDFVTILSAAATVVLVIVTIADRSK